MAGCDFTKPLLPSSDRLLQTSAEPQVVIIVPDGDLASSESAISKLQNQRENHLNGCQIEIENPYKIIGARDFVVPTTSTIDPFRNHTPKIEGFYEWLKIIIMIPIVFIRLLLFALFISIGFISTKFALGGWKDKQNPMPRWRCRLMWVTRVCARGILFSFGYHWIKRKGRPAPREIAPIVVSNHVSYIDPIFFFYELFPTIVSSESHDSIPFVGTIIRAMQVIYVNRFCPLSRKNAVNEIKRKASSNRFPRLLLFPEGTTTNGRLVISFQLGAFIPGYSVQPVIVRYPYVHFDQSWGNIALAKLMFRMFTQFHNFMEVEFLPVVSPLENQKESAACFAERTARTIANTLNVSQTCYSYGDFMLLAKASELKQDNPSVYMVEMARPELKSHISSMEAVDFLETFISMNPDASGSIKIDDFIKGLRLWPCALSEKIFRFLDVQRRGRISFKQFLLGSANVLKQPLFRKACELAFVECSSAGNHLISESELGEFIRLAVPEMKTCEIHGLFTLFDRDRDGRISREDFIVGLRRNPLLIALFLPLLTPTALDQAALPTIMVAI
ncbi:lysophospholipid acyltransferase LPEAT2-like [Impatiens glandulifera]|uniref:lysophospholipid acyltransferase LPEAT2-like n=1 Tax=Impatiens glandulifera TaxID=253017 RepID=UPI001FB0BCE8|nr:lysophospholipid acyltransferase LPEAT2-like [Impatiens glandulifera]